MNAHQAALLFLGALALTVSAREFLGANRKVNSAAVKSELDGVLAEVLGHGHGVADARLRKIQRTLTPLFRSLPKNELGHVSAPVMRYAVRRYFSQNHGWIVKGFEPHAEVANATENSGKDILISKLPSMVRATMEDRFGQDGFSLDGVIAMVASVERLAFDEVVRSVELGFWLNSIERTDVLREEDITEILSSYLIVEMLQGDDDKQKHLKLKQNIDIRYPYWSTTFLFLKDIIGSDIFERRPSANPFGENTFGFEDAVRMAERISEEFGVWSQHECHEMKDMLAEQDIHGTGRVKLSDFYTYSKDGVWQFQEPSEHLRTGGVLDESSSFLGPQVMIANYLNSMSNCVTTSSYYSICCLNECDMVFQQLEASILGSTASVSEIIKAAEGTYQSPNISDVHRERLEGIAQLHDGKVHVHGRLFAQWLHFLFPHECPYPHAAGVVKPMSQSEWLALVGIENENVSDEEIAEHLKSEFARKPASTDAGAAMWNLEESLLEASTPYDFAPRSRIWSSLRLAAQLGMVISFALLLLKNKQSYYMSNAKKAVEYDV